jgi:TrmH family RNA methyltransferase
MRTVICEYKWRNNYAVLYQNNNNDKFDFESNNLRCARVIIREMPKIDTSRISFSFSTNSTNSANLSSRILDEYREFHDHREPLRNVIDSKKHPVILEYKEYEKSHCAFIIEGERLIKRAVDDKLKIVNIIYNNKSALDKDGYINKAKCDCYRSSEGIMSAISSSKPVPNEIAACIMPEYDIPSVLKDEYTSLLITDCVNNPDNLGLIIRTADACGADAVIVTGKGAAPYHKNCVRASRGAIGRLPVFYESDGKAVIAELKAAGAAVIGTCVTAENMIDNMVHAAIPKKFAAVVGNETFGMSAEISELCDIMVKIDMARGQSSFNVAVAAGIILNRLIN